MKKTNLKKNMKKKKEEENNTEKTKIEEEKLEENQNSKDSIVYEFQKSDDLKEHQIGRDVVKKKTMKTIMKFIL